MTATKEYYDQLIRDSATELALLGWATQGNFPRGLVAYDQVNDLLIFADNNPAALGRNSLTMQLNDQTGEATLLAANMWLLEHVNTVLMELHQEFHNEVERPVLNVIMHAPLTGDVEFEHETFGDFVSAPPYQTLWKEVMHTTDTFARHHDDVKLRWEVIHAFQEVDTALMDNAMHPLFGQNYRETVSE